MHEGFGSGRNNDGLEGFSSLDFADILISESLDLNLKGADQEAEGVEHEAFQQNFDTLLLWKVKGILIQMENGPPS
jgi:hypothetical protein